MLTVKQIYKDYSHNKSIQERIEKILNTSVKEYNRLFIVRLDFHFPENVKCKNDTRVITRCFASLQAKLEHLQKNKKKKGIRIYNHGLKYLWVREIGPESNIPHYHVVLFFNKDAYFTLGKFNSTENNLFNMITAAWHSALGLKEKIKGLVHSCYFHISHLDTRAIKYQEHYEELRDYLSYLAKDYSKPYGDSKRVFGYSR